MHIRALVDTKTAALQFSQVARQRSLFLRMKLHPYPTIVVPGRTLVVNGETALGGPEWMHFNRYLHHGEGRRRPYLFSPYARGR